MQQRTISYLFVSFLLLLTKGLYAQQGYYDASYTRYEADQGDLTSATATPPSFAQSDLQSEASGQVCVDMTAAGAAVAWTVSGEGDGLVVRYSIPDGEAGELTVYVDDVPAGTIELTSHYAWQYLWEDDNPNNNGVINENPRMRFDEVRMQLPAPVPAGGNLRLERESGNIHLDFVELELVPAAVTAAGGDVTYTGDGSDLQDFINSNGSATIYLPPGVYELDRRLTFSADNTTLKGAGMWHTQLHFTNPNSSDGGGGLRATADNISFSGLYLTTVRNSRSNSYKAINGVYTQGATITDVWAEHFEVGAWIAQFWNGPDFADDFTVLHCRFRNNYADGINLSKGTRNAVVEHCSFRNNGDDDMAIWSANGMECRNNTFRYNTSENCWRAAGCAIYGGYNNTAHHLLIRDNLEAGLKVNNNFPGVGFNDNGVHTFHDITIIRCGTYNDLWYNAVGAIDIACNNVAGTRVKNVRFADIAIIDSKNDAIFIRRINGEGFYNLVFENITVDGTGQEYPHNDAQGRNGQRGFGLLFGNYPSGFGSHCNMTYANRGGNASMDVNTFQQGAFTWTQAGCGTYVTAPLNGTTFGECDPAVTITADASDANGAVDLVEFFINGTKVGEDTDPPYTWEWDDLIPGTYRIHVRSTHAPSGNTLLSPVEEVHVAYYKGLAETATPPVIDGVADPVWDNYTEESLEKISQGEVSRPEDLSATYKVTYDATHLYLLVDVTDDVLVNDAENNWENDGLEVFIDIGNDKNGGYGANDYAYQLVYDDPTVYETQHDATAGVLFAQGSKAGGYIMEISIPWATIGAVPGTGELLGFDVHINDNDGNGGRDAKKAWHDCTDNAWQSPAAFGTLQESGCTASSAPLGFGHFEGELTGGDVALNWEVYYQQDAHFRIQREAPGDDGFQTVTQMNVAGAPGTLLARSYMDFAAPAGQIAYRVRQVYAAGCAVQSTVADFHILINSLEDEAAGATIALYPNPFTGAATLQIDADDPAEVVHIKDMTGKSCGSRKLSGNGPYSIGENLPPGMYLLEVWGGDARQVVRFIKL